MSNSEINTVILALSMLLISSFICGRLFEKIKAPKVVGEIIGGMLVGGSGLALISPNIYNNIFNGFIGEEKVLNLIYQLGLIFLMFSSGFNTDIHITKKTIKSYSLLFIGATFIPIVLGIPFIGIFDEYFIGSANTLESFAIVFLISIAITSIPVISKIFFDIDMMNTEYSNMVLTVSTIQDLCLWIALNVSISIVETGTFTIQSLIITTILTIGLILIANIIGKILNNHNIKIRNNIISNSIIIILLIVYTLSLLNINIMYSAFISGYIIKSIVEKENDSIESIKNFSFSFFVPIYFALVGLRLDIVHNFSINRFTAFFIVAFGLEFIGTCLVMIFSKLKKKTIISLGITMNARGGPGIVLATTAFTYNIINIEFFTVLILTTMLSSAIAGYWLRYYKEEIKNIY